MAPRKTDSVSWKRGARESLWTIRKLDSEPILRYDLQYQVLEHIFNDRTFVFTSPFSSHSSPESNRVHFDQLYFDSILASTKTNTNLRTKLLENPVFAANLCKLCFLINIGRINTTLAFYPQMKTALRTYHPIPSLQTDEMSQNQMQDSPRLKSLLKATFLPSELPPSSPPTTLFELGSKPGPFSSSKESSIPRTTVMNAIFIMFNEAHSIQEKYLPPGWDLLDLFYPSEFESLPRAKTFLKILHRILEQDSFLHDFNVNSSLTSSSSSKDDEKNKKIEFEPRIELDKKPTLIKENIDSVSELEFIKEMKIVREQVVKLVPAIQQREAEMRANLLKREAAVVAENTGEPIVTNVAGLADLKKRKIGRKGKGRSWAAVERELKTAERDILPSDWKEEDWDREEPRKESNLLDTWNKISKEMVENRDPDYDSEEGEPWPFDLLLRRRLLTFRNPTTGVRQPVKEIPEFEEWKKRREAGQVGDDEGDEDGVDAAGEEVDGAGDEED